MVTLVHVCVRSVMNQFVMSDVRFYSTPSVLGCDKYI